MNQASNETAGQGLNLPPPEQLPQIEAVGEVTAKQMPAVPEIAPLPSQAAPAVLPVLPVNIPAPASGSVSSDVNDTSQASDLSVLDDTDLIDKAVVEKAKAIVSRNREDPYQQTQEISELKADFMQKNYNKVVKLNK